jgi:CrcB protein
MLLVDATLVGVGGLLGGLARIGISSLVALVAGDRFPWGTLAVNLSGSFAIGLLAGSAMGASSLGLFLMTGVLGSYTTVSTFSLQTLFLLEQGLIARALANIAGSVLLCLLAASLGYRLMAG